MTQQQVKKLADWQRLKALVLDSVSSPIMRRVNMALNEFTDCYWVISEAIGTLALCGGDIKGY